MRMRLKTLLIGLAWLAGCALHVPPAGAQCVNSTNTCGASTTTYLLMCRLPRTCKQPDYAANLENALIKLDHKFAPTTLLEGHGHRGTDGDGPKLGAATALDCDNSPSNGNTLSWATGTGQCHWMTGGGAGNVTGPGTSLDTSIPVWDGTGGTALLGDRHWFIDSANTQYTTDGHLGIGTAVPGALIDVQNVALGEQIFNGTVTGSEVTSRTTFSLIDGTTSATGSVAKTIMSVSDGGSTWNGVNSPTYGLLLDVSGSTATNNYALYALNGDVVVASGRIGVGDITPDYLIEAEDTNGATLPLGVTVSGTRATTAGGAVIANTATGGDGASFKTGLTITNGGSYNGFNVGVLANVSGGTLANVAYLALAGDIQTQSGQVSATNTTRAGDFACSGNPTSCTRVVSTNMSGGNVALRTDASGTGQLQGAQFNVTGSGSGSASGFFGTVVNSSTGDATGEKWVVTGNATGSTTGIEVRADGNGSSTDAAGVTIYANNTGGSGRHIALDVHDGDLSVDSDLSGAPGLYYHADTSQLIINNGFTSTDGATVEFHNNGAADNIALANYCTVDSGGDDCFHTETQNSGTAGTVQAASLVAGGNASGDTAIALSLTASGASTNYGENVIAGDVVWGAINTLEDMHWYQNTSQIVMNVDSGAPSDSGGNFLEVHGAPGKIAVETYATADAGVGVTANLSGAVTSASGGAIIASNTQTSGTSSINKVGLSANSTGTWNGSSAINSAVTGVATGGTENFAFWGQAGGIRNGGAYIDDVQTESVADNGGGGNATLTLSVTKSFVIITCNDVQGCDITMSETAIRQGTRVTVMCTGGAGPCNFADTGGVSELAGTFAAGDNDTISMIYAGSAWVETARSNN